MKPQTILDLVGHSPIIQFQNMPEFKKFRLEDTQCFFKLEYFNPLQSVKDRIAKAMIESAEQTGQLRPGMSIIEPTSGNTGVGLAFVAAAKGYKITLVMPETMSMERRILLLMLGAELILTPGPLGMKGAIAKAEAIFAVTSNCYMPRQFSNPANPEVHYLTTGPEIWTDTHGTIDILIAGVGTGGTLSGAGRYLREKNPKLQIVALEPTESPVISGGQPSPHKIQGIGAGFIPDNLDESLITSIATSQRVIREEGVPTGISSGAAVMAAIRVASNPLNKGKTIVTVLASAIERYLSSMLGEEARNKAIALKVTEV